MYTFMHIAIYIRRYIHLCIYIFIYIYIYIYICMVNSLENHTIPRQRDHEGSKLKNCIWVVGMKPGIWGRKTLKLGMIILIILT